MSSFTRPIFFPSADKPSSSSSSSSSALDLGAPPTRSTARRRGPYLVRTSSLNDIIKELPPDQLEPLFELPLDVDIRCVQARSGSNLVGYMALYRREGDESKDFASSPYGVAGVHVSPGYRGKGVGAALMDQALAQSLISSKVYHQTLTSESSHM